jgi:hypothetical protein
MEFLEVELRFYTVAILKVSHQYFGAENPDMFLFVPSETTQEKINRWGIIVRRQQDNIVLLVSSDNIDGFFKILDDEKNLIFDFYLHVNDNILAQYTDMPFDKRGKILYFSNENKKIEKKSTHKNVVQLHTQNTIQAEDWINYKTGNLVIQEQNALLEIKNEANQVVFSKQTTKESPHTHINLLELSEGKYSLEINGKSTENFACISPAHAGKALALVKISIDDVWKKDMLNSFSQNKNDAYHFFEMNFATRNVFWRYYLISRFETLLQNTVIDTQNKTLEFASPKEQLLKNGQTAWVFEANKSLPLQKNNIHNFQLLRKKDHKGNPIHLVLRQLPCPTVDMILPDSRKEDAKVFADMVVYL